MERSYLARWLRRMLLLALLGPLAAAAQALTPVSIVSLVVSSSYLPLWVAVDQGLFAKHGIDARLRFPPLAYRSIGKEYPFGVVGVPAVLAGVVEGQNLKLLMLVDTPRVTAQLIAQPGVRTAQDLAGKRFGIATVGTGAWINSHIGLDHLGVDPVQAGIRFVEVGSGSAALAKALQEGRVDVVSIDPGEAAELRKKGFDLLLDLGAANLIGVQSGLAVDADYLRANPEVAERMVAAMIEAMAFSLSPGNEAVVRRVLASRMKLENNPVAVDVGYRSFVARANRSGIISLPAVRNMQRVMARADAKVLAVTIESLVDDRPLRKLEETGALDRMYRDYGVRN